MKTYLVTGGAGFIGSHFIRHMLGVFGEDISIYNVDALTYAGNLANLEAVKNHPHYHFVKQNINSPELEDLFKSHTFDAVVHFAAESHVDRSIIDSLPFIDTNVRGTQRLLDFARKYNVKRFCHISTDEVYGSLGDTGSFTENTPLAPNSPYSASKAGADLLVRAAFETYQFPVNIVRCSNNYGPNQFPEKLIPLMITNAFEGKPLPVYGKGRNIRDWIYVTDFCSAIQTVLEKGIPGEIYNVGGDSEKTNIDVVKMILEKVGDTNSEIQYVKDRLGHDFRYAIDYRKIHQELGWSPQVSFEEGLERTVTWYKSNAKWWQDIKSGVYMAYYEKQYGTR
ncbi:MAG: dTDP-glucose 4,6-dehydratase [Candidatus Margulisbacteria bacterium]|nr:dTDP-glucose 4,6-dehydratase [Candidatus Margulisiibacteriota bacterium]